MTNKTVLIGIGILAVGLIALPQTFALFAGQHNWYDVTADNTTNYGIPCKKCHSDVYEELRLSRNGTGPGVHKNTECVDCHVAALVNKEGGQLGGGDTAGDNIHAAGLPACMDCHGGTGFFPGAANASTIMNGSLEAHKPFANAAAAQNEANGTALLKGANEACIACHTHVAVDINWQKAYKIAFNAIETADTGIHSWTVSNFVAEGKVTTLTYGNRTGQTTGFNETSIDVSGLTIPNYSANNP